MMLVQRHGYFSMISWHPKLNLMLQCFFFNLCVPSTSVVSMIVPANCTKFLPVYDVGTKTWVPFND